MSDLKELRKTPLFDVHQKAGGKIIDFGGWALPVQFQGIIDEHHAVRTQAGLFDVSHMGEIRVRGTDACRFVDYLMTNDVCSLAVGQILYTPMCYPDGGVVDDLLVYRMGDDDFLLVVNAANTEKDVAWVQRYAVDFEVGVTDESPDTAQLALQGPRAQEILGRLVDVDLDEIKFFWFREGVLVAGHPALVSRTGYTGEDGFEIYCKPEYAVAIWEALMESGAPDGLVPVGLGARDTLRFEAGLSLYGHELGPDINPLEARLNYFVKLDAAEFIGREALLTAKEQGLSKKLVGFEMLERGVPRQQYPIFNAEGQEVGYVSSGSFAPTLQKNIGLGFVVPELTKRGTQLQIGIRNRKLGAEVIKIPFYKREG